jgi:hypothetical protein
MGRLHDALRVRTRETGSVPGRHVIENGVVTTRRTVHPDRTVI